METNVETQAPEISQKKEKKKTNWWAVLIVIIILGVIGKFKGDGDSGAVRVSSWDHSVGVVEDYLKHSYLRDPDSYQSVKWYKVQKNADGTYSVAHTFRARNGFGGMNENTLTFYISKDGQNVTGHD